MKHHDFMQQYLDQGYWEQVRETITACGIFQLINAFNRKVVGAEIGIKEGMNCIALLEMCPNIEKLIGIDPFIPYQDLGYFWSEEEQESIYQYMLKNVRVRNCEDRFEHRRMTSMDAVGTLEDNSLDFVFIDGEHTGNAIQAELTAYLPKLVSGGIMSGHDYDKVGSAVQSWVAANQPGSCVKHIPNSSWYFIKH